MGDWLRTSSIVHISPEPFSSQLPFVRLLVSQNALQVCCHLRQDCLGLLDLSSPDHPRLLCFLYCFMQSVNDSVLSKHFLHLGRGLCHFSLFFCLHRMLNASFEKHLLIVRQLNFFLEILQCALASMHFVRIYTCIFCFDNRCLHFDRVVRVQRLFHCLFRIFLSLLSHKLLESFSACFSLGGTNARGMRLLEGHVQRANEII
mmetsp:Transcript_48317/g.76380  ORF Transcript_48317/g.76380 Transcript_48317/m.76380 type:complete len:203 (+) Transcript_48317:1588-2196(+)